MRDCGFARLDAADARAVEDYERAFYAAFARVTSNRLVRRLWLWDDEQRRLKTRVAYDDQTIWISRRADGALHIAIAAQFAPLTAQSAAYGFRVPPAPRVFEILAFFAAARLSFGELRSFWAQFVAAMRDAGMGEGYATTAKPLLPIYRRGGWEIVDTTTIDGEARFFLRLSLDCDAAQSLLRAHDAACVDAHFVAALTGGGDARLDVEPATGRNIYGCRPRPDPDEYRFGSTTASTITAPAFAAARVCHARLAPADAAPSIAARRDEARAIAQEIAELAGLSGARALLAPSGTDAALLATAMIAEQDAAPLTTILVGPEETGSGVADAVLGRYFQRRTPQGLTVVPGASAYCGRAMARVDAPLRGPDGTPLPLAEIDAAVAAAAQREIDAGRRVAIHRLDSSKTGLTAPSLACLDALQAAYGASVSVLVDACQMRVSAASLGAYHRRGWPILVTGSKMIGGPAFSGAVILPADCDAPPPDVPGYDPPEAPALGALLRWRAALVEWRAFADVPDARKAACSQRFADLVSRRIAERPWLRAVPGGPSDRAAPGGWGAAPSIFSFQLLARDGAALGFSELRRLFLALLEPQGEAPAMRIGQPVALGAAGAALRIALDARAMSRLTQNADALAQIDAALARLLNRLERLAGAGSV
jgi:hypothetical protein